MKKINRRCLCIIILICLSIVVIAFVSSYITDSWIGSWIREEEIVYIPDRLASDNYHMYWAIDDVDYWLVKPDENQRKAILEDIDSNIAWNEFEPRHKELLAKYTEFEQEIELASAINNSNKKYICVYDFFNKQIVTDELDFSKVNTSQWLFFVYDVDANLYHCYYYTF